MGFQPDNRSRHYDGDRIDRNDCRAFIKKGLEVKTPVRVDVRTTTGGVNIVCAKPRITESETLSIQQCSSKCEFTISQKICVEIPISYRIRADVKDSFVDCDVDCDIGPDC